MDFGIPPALLPSLFSSLLLSFPSINIYVGSLCARPCAGYGDAETNENQTLLLKDSQLGRRGQIQHRQ